MPLIFLANNLSAARFTVKSGKVLGFSRCDEFAMTELSPVARQAARRRTFAIISHPDAGKTTLTEKLLLFSGAIQTAGTVKGKKSGKFATSDWMEIEKQRGFPLLAR